MGKLIGAGLFDLEKHFSIYRAHHSNPINVLIHTVFTWPMLFFTLVILYFTPPLIYGVLMSFPIIGSQYGSPLHLMYAVFYICLDRKAGSLAAFLCLVFWVSASFLAKNLGFSLAWKVVLVTEIICLTRQIIGHCVFEKRVPTIALLDMNLLQSFVMAPSALFDILLQPFVLAPFFIVLEILQMGFGYEPYPGFHAKVKGNIDAKIKIFKEKKVM